MNVAIIGTGNIGTDLLIKILKSNQLSIAAFVGRRDTSDGIQLAKKQNVYTSIDGINFFTKENIEKYNIKIVFDCTDAYTALQNWNVFNTLNIKVIDLTPAKIGPLCIPILNKEKILTNNNINMITCGGQTSIPLLNSISLLYHSIEYIEVVSQISSKSAGIATRNNLDQYILTTEKAISLFTGCNSTKVILNLNPAEPCVNMQTTLFIQTKTPIDINVLSEILNTRIKRVQKYIPNYNLVLDPVINNDKLILSIQVKGSGDYLPEYAGNLDIINCAAIEVANFYENNYN